MTDKRDERGRFVKGGKKLSSEEARDMQKKRWSKAKEDSTESLLADAGYTDEHQPPEHLKVLAEIAASKGSGSVPAMRDFLKLTVKPEVAGKPGKPKPGEVCPTCSELVMTDFRPTAEQCQDAADFIELGRNWLTKTYDDREELPETGNPFDDGSNGE